MAIVSAGLITANRLYHQGDSFGVIYSLLEAVEVVCPPSHHVLTITIESGFMDVSRPNLVTLCMIHLTLYCIGIETGFIYILHAIVRTPRGAKRLLPATLPSYPVPSFADLIVLSLIHSLQFYPDRNTSRWLPVITFIFCKSTTT